jgi:hypothetical protein
MFIDYRDKTAEISEVGISHPIYKYTLAELKKG